MAQDSGLWVFVQQPWRLIVSGSYLCFPGDLATPGGGVGGFFGSKLAIQSFPGT